MNRKPTTESSSAPRRTFTAAWSANLGAAIIAAAPAKGYYMSLVGEDAQAVVAAVNQGIDAYLEACFVPERGDRCGFAGARLHCHLSPASLATLVRRLLQSDDAAATLAAGICQTLGLELV